MVTRIPLRRHDDERGWFMELMRASALPKPVRQANLARSRRGVNEDNSGVSSTSVVVARPAANVVLLMTFSRN